MARLPVIIGFGGVNPAGRVSSHHAFRRLVIDRVGTTDAEATLKSLATLTGLEGDPTEAANRQYLLDNTLVRRIQHFDPAAVAWQRKVTLRPGEDDLGGGKVRFVMDGSDLPEQVPEAWTVAERADGRFEVMVSAEGTEVLLPDHKVSRVSSAGQLPTGFDPGSLYQSRSHPRGLQLAVYGASDAVRSVGFDWSELRDRVPPDQFTTYSGSAMGQLDYDGSGGMLQASMIGKRTTSKHLALGLCDMPANFINAYVVGSVGSTGAVIGACATFLYNLKQAVDQIKSGARRVAIVGSAEAPLTPEVIEGYRTMGALAEDKALMALDGTDTVDNSRACRPFSDNCGFTLSEGSVYFILADDELALELGANIHGAVGDVFVNADGYKRSIPGPGIGNYVTMAKAMALGRSILGEDSLRHRSYVHAHGTGTPQNRVTESHILNELAKTFGIERWPVAAIKAYLGHSLGPASADQLAMTLGTWAHGLIPGIATIDHIADDVHHSNLVIQPDHIDVEPTEIDMSMINAKGFGGNNATGLVLGPHVVRQMLEARHGAAAMARHAKANESVAQAATDYDQSASRGESPPIYQFGKGVLTGEEIELSDTEIRIPGYDHAVSLNLDNPFGDMTSSTD